MIKRFRNDSLQLVNAVLIFLLIGIAFLLSSCSRKSDGSENKIDPLVPAVEAVQAHYGALPLTQRLSGIVKAKNQVAIYPEISAVITDVLVKNGETVKQGQTLVQLRDREFRERLKQAKANYRIAVAQARQAEAQLKEIQSELNRVKALAEKELTSASDLETIQTRAVSAEANVELAKARVEQAQANVDEQDENLAQTVIRAPVAGSIGNRNAEVGMLVTNSTRLFTLGQLDNVRVEVVLTDQMLNYIKEGQRTEIFATNLLSGPLSAALSRISPFLHPVTHSTDAEIDMANPDGRLIPGMFVTVDIFYGESEQATLVPLSALYENPATGATGVYVTKASLNREPVGKLAGQSISFTDPVTFEFVPVEVIAKGRMEAGIRGADDGDWVVTLGQNLLGSESGTARVRPVKWDWVKQLQLLQREDLMQDLLKRQQTAEKDTVSSDQENHTSG